MKHVGHILTLVIFLSFGCAEDATTGGAIMPDQALPDASSDLGIADAMPDMVAVLPDVVAPDATQGNDAAVEPDSEIDAGLATCEPALSLTASATAARPFDLVRLRPAGGTGAWRFSLATNESGAILNETTGAYLAGEESGTVDRVLLLDDGCIGEAHYDIRVVNAMQVHPNRAEVEQEQSFQFRVDEGSGEFEFELTAARSGAEITVDGFYTAGPARGSDTVRVRDVQTGQTKDVIIDVVNRVVLRPTPAQLFIPVGSTAGLVISGGTGEFDVEVSGPGVVVEGDEISAVSAGRFELAITDAFIGVQTQMVVHAVESLTAELVPFDDVHVSFRTVAAGDLNGDGIADFVTASSSADIDYGNSGAVFVYHSGPEGFGPDPVQIFSGASADEEYGRSVALGDVNGDGLTDLVVGARLADPGMNDAGSLLIYFGQPGGLFAEAPNEVLAGVRGGDQLGFSVAVCDFNGDGRLDIAGGALAYEDRDSQPIAFTQGAVFIFLGYEDGFLDEPDQIVTGQRWDGNGNWSDYRDLQFAADLAAGDMDADGRCDLAVGANRYRVNQQNNAGAVFIFRGRARDAVSPGGITPRPSKMIQADGIQENGGSFGRRLHMADINGDERTDLVVGENGGDTGGRDRGAAYIFLGGDFEGDEMSSTTSILTADGFYPGDSNYDNDGIAVSVGDVTGDGLPDLVVGGYVDDPPGQSDAGRITIYAGRANDVPAAELTREIDGIARDMRMGEAIAVVGDINADGLNDIVTHAQRDHTTAPFAGQTFVITRGPQVLEDPPGEDAGMPMEPPIVDVFTPVQFPRTVGAGRFGNGVALLGDVTGDGFEDVVVTAPWVTDTHTRSGGAWIYRGQADGVDTNGVSLGQFANHSHYDQLWSATRVGDFDGDGNEDFALLLRDDERPDDRGLSNGEWGLPAEPCGPRSYNTGGIYVFRGTANGLVEPRPSFAIWQGMPGLSPEAISGGIDFNGDGRGDIVLGAYRWDPDGRTNAGASLVFTGREFEAEPGEIQVICDTYFRYEGPQASMESGRAIVAVGDINGDGCDDFATGSRAEDRPELNDEGGVRILYGYGAAGCPPGARMLRLATGERFGQAGWSLAAGDLDGDDIPDLVVGAWQRRRDNIPLGGAWVVPGSYLREVEPRSLAVGDGEQPMLLNQWGNQWLVEGQLRDGQAGHSVAVAGPYLAIGAPQDTVGPMTRSGTVRIYRVTSEGIDSEPVALVVGESNRPSGRLGHSLAGGMMNGQPTFVVGANYGNGTGLDNGSAYVLRLDAVGD